MRPVERPAELGGVDPPLALGALDHRRLTGVPDVDRLAGQYRPRARATPSARSRRSSARARARRAAPPRPRRGRPARRGRTSSGARAAVDRDLAAGEQAGRASSGRCGRRSTRTTATAPGRVAWTSREGSGPSASRTSSTSLRNSSLASSQSRVSSQGGQAAISARWSRRSAIGRMPSPSSYTSRCVEQLVEVARLVRRAQPRPADQVVARRDRRGRLHRQRGQLARPPLSRSVGLRASSSVARTTTCRASCRVRWWGSAMAWTSAPGDGEEDALADERDEDPVVASDGGMEVAGLEGATGHRHGVSQPPVAYVGDFDPDRGAELVRGHPGRGDDAVAVPGQGDLAAVAVARGDRLRRGSGP